MRSRSALVTGASRGIGLAVAQGLAAEGFDLTLSARSQDTLEAVARRIKDTNHVSVRVHPADMSVEEDVLSLANYYGDAHDSLDVLVLNAGMGSIGAFAEYPVRRLDKLMAINFRSGYVLTQALLPHLRKAGAEASGGSRVIAVASSTGIFGVPLNSAYGATKAALISWCETLSTEESANGLSATAVCPGYVATHMTEGLDGVPPEEMIPAADVAEAVVCVTRLSRRTVIPRIVLSRPGPQMWRA